jgi:extradiol dioxygenase family protein
MTLQAFHIAIPSLDLEASTRFYGEQLGLREGRRAERWVDYDFFGHQLSIHLTEALSDIGTNLVDSENVPVRHFGLILEWSAWHAWRDRLRELGLSFRIEPQIRFKGEVGEQATLFIEDPSGNALEFKSFKDPGRVFAR